MLGLRSHGRFAGATRLLDEWVTGLEPFWAKGPRDVTDDVAVALFGDAAARVRKFARRGGALEPVAPDADGLLRFELQGWDYVARAAKHTLPDLAATEHVTARLREGLDGVRARLAGEEQGVFALVLAAESKTPIEARAWVDAITALTPSAIAWAFPDARDPFGHRGVTPERPGLALVLAWTEDATFGGSGVDPT